MTSDILLICRASDNTSSSRNLQVLKNVFQKLLEKSNSSSVLLARIKCNKDICIFLHGTAELHLWEAAPWWGSASMKLYQISQILKMTIGAPVPTATMQLWIKWSCPVLFFFFFFTAKTVLSSFGTSIHLTELGGEAFHIFYSETFSGSSKIKNLVIFNACYSFIH